MWAYSKDTRTVNTWHYFYIMWEGEVCPIFRSILSWSGFCYMDYCEGNKLLLFLSFKCHMINYNTSKVVQAILGYIGPQSFQLYCHNLEPISPSMAVMFAYFIRDYFFSDDRKRALHINIRVHCKNANLVDCVISLLIWRKL